MALIVVMSLTAFSACGSSDGAEDITTADVNAIEVQTTDASDGETDIVEKKVFSIGSLKGATTMGK